MKQVVEVTIAVTLDYDNPEVSQIVNEQMVKLGWTIDQVRQEVRESLVAELKEAADDILSEYDQGCTYEVYHEEDISK